jgi:hypothetical protein
MPSWSSSDVGNEEDEAATPPAEPAPTEVESARKLLKELFAEPEAEDPPTQPEH